MGEYADLAIDEMFNHEDYDEQHPYESDEDVCYQRPLIKRAVQEKICNRCGKGNLHWRLKLLPGPDVWVLAEPDNAIHKCKPEDYKQFQLNINKTKHKQTK